MIDISELALSSTGSQKLPEIQCNVRFDWNSCPYARFDVIEKVPKFVWRSSMFFQ